MNKTALLFVLLISAFMVFSQEKSYKRGVAYGYHSEKDMEEYSKYISWWYNWASQPDAAIRNNYRDYNVDFTPMAWNISGISGVKYWADRDSSIKYILGFNEPNFLEQANIVPSKAAQAWPSLQKIAEDHGLKIVSPAVNYCGNCVSENGVTYTNPFKYLDDFFAACSDCQVDFIGLHWYGGGSSIVNYIDDARKYNKPLWITEFAAWDSSVKNKQDQIKFLAGAVNYLEREPIVYRYSWFIGRTAAGTDTYPYIDLYAKESGMLTELGQLYMDIPVYDPDKKFAVPCRIEAEEYYLMSGLYAELTQDEEGFLDMTSADVRDWAEYKISVPADGTYLLSARVAGYNGAIDFKVDNVTTGRLHVTSTGGGQTWQTFLMEIELEAGEHVLQAMIRDAGFNINWFEISYPTATLPKYEIAEADIYPNPVTLGIVNVSLKNVIAGDDYVCTLHNMAGEQVFSKEVKPNRAFFQLNIFENGKLNPGAYFLKITGKKAQAKKMLIVR